MHILNRTFEYNLKLLNDDLLENLETEMLVCFSPYSKINLE